MMDSWRLLTRRQTGVSLSSAIPAECATFSRAYRPAESFTYWAIWAPVANHTPGFDFM